MPGELQRVGLTLFLVIPAMMLRHTPAQLDIQKLVGTPQAADGGAVALLE